MGFLPYRDIGAAFFAADAGETCEWESSHIRVLMPRF